MTARHLYTSTATRCGDVWWVQCDQVPSATSTVADLRDAISHQREAIAFVEQIPEDEVVVAINQKWALYCDGDFIYSTTDEEDAQSWVDADPAGHTMVLEP